MKDFFENLSKLIGAYQGEGINHEGQSFVGRLMIASGPTPVGMRLSFTATATEGNTIYHSEESLIGPAMEGKPGLWVLSNNHPAVFQRLLRHDGPKEGSERTFVFGLNDRGDRSAFREEISIDLWPNGDLSYRYAWGMPGGEFAERSGARMMKVAKVVANRPDNIKHYAELQESEAGHYPNSNEPLSIGAPFAKSLGLTRIGIHHELLPSGQRTSWPHAEQDEEEFIYVIDGNPDVWMDGHLYRLNPGDGVGFPCGTGLSHTFINNTNTDVRLLVVGEASKKTSKIFYPLNPERKEQVKDGWWTDVPKRPIGPHDGLPDKQRQSRSNQ